MVLGIQEHNMKHTFLFLFVALLLLSCAKQELKQTTAKQESHTAKHKVDPASVHFLLEGKKVDEAIKVQLLSQAINLDSLNDAAHYELALFYTKQSPEQSIEKAVSHLQKAIQIDDSNPWYLHLYGRLLVDTEQYSKGIAVFENLIERYPQNRSYVYDLAYSYEQSGNYQKAIDLFDEIEQQQGFDPQLNYLKHELYMQMGEIEQSIAEVEEIVDNNPEYVSYAAYLSNYYLSINNFEKAEHYTNIILQQQPNDPQGLVAKAKLAAGKSEKAEIIKNLTQLFDSELSLDQKVQLVIPFIEISTLNAAAKEGTIQSFKYLSTQYQNDPKPFALLGDAYASNQQFEEAMNAYKQAISFESCTYSVWEQFLILLSDKREHENVNIYAKQAIEKFPEEFIPHYLHGFSSIQQNHYEQGIPSLQKALTFVTENASMKAELNAALADAYYQNKQYSESFSTFEKVLQTNPNDAFILNNYSYYLATQNENLAKAEQMAKLAKELNSSANTIDTYAFVLFQMKRYEESLVFFQQAYEMAETSPVITEHLGDAYYKVGDVDKAIYYWKKAYTLEENSRVLEKINSQTFVPYE